MRADVDPEVVFCVSQRREERCEYGANDEEPRDGGIGKPRGEHDVVDSGKVALLNRKRSGVFVEQAWKWLELSWNEPHLADFWSFILDLYINALPA